MVEVRFSAPDRKLLDLLEEARDYVEGYHAEHRLLVTKELLDQIDSALRARNG